MSSLKIAFVLVAGLGALAAQTVSDSPGVTVETNGAHMRHRGAVYYPSEAVAKRIEGTVTAQVKLDSTGSVVDASIVSGPDEFRKTVLLSLLNWHFGADTANSTRQVSIFFRLPEGTPQQSRPVAEARASDFRLPPNPAGSEPTSTLKSIVIRGLSDADEQALRAKLGVHEGDSVTMESMVRLSIVAHMFDQHLRIAPGRTAANETIVTISTPDADQPRILPVPDASYKGPGIRVGGAVQQSKLLSQPAPVYPPLAKEARVQGVVRFEAVIGKDGAVQNLRVISGHPILIQAAQEAVKQWTYRPTLLNGNPTEVVTTIDVNFTLAQ